VSLFEISGGPDIDEDGAAAMGLRYRAVGDNELPG
jgi:hypothetical protein